MDKKDFCTILQVALFSFDGATEQEILNYNAYPAKLVRVGIKLCTYLQSIKLESNL